MTPALRRPLLTLHTWVGLVLGVVLLVVAVSGAVLVFRPLLERRLDPDRFIVPAAPGRVSLDTLIDKAKVDHPEGQFQSVRYYGDPTMPFLALFSTREYVHLNPHTGEVLGTRARYGEGFGWVEGIHKYLTIDPDIGENVNGSLAFVFSGLVLTGIVLWWPATRRALKAGLSLNWKLKGRPWNLNLHKTLGAYAGLIILFSALTGIPIALDSTRVVLNALTFSSGETAPPPRPSPNARFVGFDAIAAQIQRLMPNAQETYIALPRDGLVTAYAIAEDAPNPNARSYLWCAADTGTVVKYRPFATSSRGYRLYYWLLSLHTATTGGWTVRIVLLLGTLSVPILTYTGVMSYLRRKSRRTAGAAEQRPVTSSNVVPSLAE